MTYVSLYTVVMWSAENGKWTYILQGPDATSMTLRVPIDLGWRTDEQIFIDLSPQKESP